MSKDRISFRDRTYAVIGGIEFPVIKKFQIANIGWECDSDGYIINYYGVPRLLLSNHGLHQLIPCDMIDPVGEGPIRNDVTALELQINSYEDLIGQTKEAINILKGESNEKV